VREFVTVTIRDQHGRFVDMREVEYVGAGTYDFQTVVEILGQHIPLRVCVKLPRRRPRWKRGRRKTRNQTRRITDLFARHGFPLHTHIHVSSKRNGSNHWGAE